MANETIGGIKRLSLYMAGQLASNVAITGGTISGVTLSGAQTVTGLFSQSATVTATALGSSWNIFSNTFSATGIVSGNGRGIRGVATISGTVTGGAFIEGVQGKVVLSGTLNHADARVSGGFSQLDASAGTHTAGYLDGHWIDMGATGPAGGFASGYSQVVRATNTTAGNVNSIYYGYGKADFGLDLSDNSSGWITIGTPPTTLSGSIKVNVNGNTRYIPLYTAAS